MKVSLDGLNLIKRWEGCRLKAYRDSVKVLTIGYGHTSAAGQPVVTESMTITQKQADDMLARDLGKYEDAVQRAITKPATQHQLDAMTSLCYNIGPGAFAKSSIVRKFNAGDVAGAANSFLLFNKAGGKVLTGLTRRREDEKKLFLTK